MAKTTANENVVRHHRTTYEAAKNVIAVLLRRGGFDHWWFGVDRQTRNEIIHEVSKQIKKDLVK